MNTKTKTGILTAILAAAVVLVSAQVYANTVASFARVGFDFFPGNNVAFLVPLDAAGNTTRTFSGSGRKVIMYTAVCGNFDAGFYTQLDIIVDGVLLAPTGGDNFDAFCQEGADIDFEYHTVTGRTNALGTGTHTLQILGHSPGPSGSAIGNSSTLVMK